MRFDYMRAPLATQTSLKCSSCAIDHDSAQKVDEWLHPTRACPQKRQFHTPNLLQNFHAYSKTSNCYGAQLLPGGISKLWLDGNEVDQPSVSQCNSNLENGVRCMDGSTDPCNMQLFLGGPAGKPTTHSVYLGTVSNNVNTRMVIATRDKSMSQVCASLRCVNRPPKQR